MDFLGWINKDGAMYKVASNLSAIIVEEYKGGHAVEGSRRELSRSEFVAYVREMELDVSTLSRGIKRVIEHHI